MRAACVQLCCGPDVAENFASAETLIRKAAADGAAFVATPENTLILEAGRSELFAALSPEVLARYKQKYSALAAELNIFLLIGSVAAPLDARRAANRSLVFAPDGRELASYDKMHMFDVDISKEETWRESATYEAGQNPVMVAVGEFSLGLSICYDLRFAALYKYYAQNGANILAVPSAFTRPTGKAHWETLLRARAIETSSYVIAPAQGGTHPSGRRTWGHSMMIDPWGEVIAQTGDDKPGICAAELSLDAVARARRKIPAWQQATQLPN